MTAAMMAMTPRLPAPRLRMTKVEVFSSFGGKVSEVGVSDSSSVSNSECGRSTFIIGSAEAKHIILYSAAALTVTCPESPA